MADKLRLGIIGGGASAALFLLNLAQEEGAERFEIDVFDRTLRFARGVAYGTEYTTHRLNVRAANMSAFAAIPDDFAIWAAERYQFAPDAFVPRTVYAQYLAERLEEVRPRLKVRFLHGDVVSCRRTNDELFALKAGDYHQSYRYVLKATGNVRLIEPRKDTELKNYVAEPWYMEGFKNIPDRKGKVVILGSGLSAADAIASLHTHGYEGAIVILSRKGLLPRLHTEQKKYAPFLENLRQSPARLMKRIRDEVRSAEKQGVPWQSVIDALRSVTNEIWQGWDERCRATFLRHALTLWNVHRHRMSLDTAAIIETMSDGGRIQMVRDSIVRIEGPGRVVCRSCEIDADMIINALGYRYDEGRIFDYTHAIGPARFGELFETTAIPEIRAQAAEIAQSLTA